MEYQKCRGTKRSADSENPSPQHSTSPSHNNGVSTEHSVHYHSGHPATTDTGRGPTETPVWHGQPVRGRHSSRNTLKKKLGRGRKDLGNQAQTYSEPSNYLEQRDLGIADGHNFQYQNGLGVDTGITVSRPMRVQQMTGSSLQSHHQTAAEQASEEFDEVRSVSPMSDSPRLPLPERNVSMMSTTRPELQARYPT